MINDHKTRRECKIPLTMQINFISHKDSEETGTMYTKTCNIEITKGNKTDEKKKTDEKTFWISFTKLSKKILEELIRGSKSGSASIDLLYYHLQKVGLKRSRSYIDSPEWLKNKKATINRKSNDDNCFQDALTVALNHQNIEKNSQKIS